MNVAAATYLFSVNKTRQEESVSLSELDGGDFLIFLSNLFKNIKEIDKVDQHSIETKIASLSVGRRTLCGSLLYGRYGYSAEGRDVVGNKESYDRTTGHAEMIPFGFHFYVPDGKHQGIMILQRFGALGIFSPVIKMLRDAFRLKYSGSGLTLKIEPIVHADVLKDFTTKSHAKKVRFRMHSTPQELCDAIGNNCKPTNSYVEISVVAKKQFSLGSFIGIAGKNFAKANLFSMTDFRPDEVLLDVKMNGRQRTISVGNQTALRSYFDLSKQVKLGKDGLPIPALLTKELNQLAEDLWKQIT